jgi:hypothetical protein
MMRQSTINRNEIIANNIIMVVSLISIFSLSRHQIIDDAYISFRYAYNLSHSGELTFNVGERVEGISNLLWTIILSVAMKVSHNPIEILSLLISFGLITYTYYRLRKLGSLFGIPLIINNIPPLILLLSPDFVKITTNGLESALYTTLLTETFYYFYTEKQEAAYLCSGFLFMTRPEGLIIGVLLITANYQLYKSTKKSYIGIAVFPVFVIVISSFRWLYYKALIPNSVIAKFFDIYLLGQRVEIIISYFNNFIKSNPIFVLILIWGIILFFTGGVKERKLNLLLVLSILIIIFSYIIALRNGGDWMPNNRLTVQYGAMYAIVLMLAISQNKINSSIAWVFTFFLLIQTTFSIWANFNSQFLSYQCWSFYQETSERLSKIVDKKDLISAEALGCISYRLINIQFHDPIGLTNYYIARNGNPSITFGKTDPAYTIGEIEPSIMIWHSVGHLTGIESPLMNKYVIFCSNDCDNWDADIVMIRSDRFQDVSPFFLDWQRMVIRDSFLEPAR